MPYLIDSHCHIHDRSVYNYAFSRQQISKKLLKNYPNLPRQPEDFTPKKLIERARANNVQKMICIGTSHDDSMVACAFAEAHSADNIFWSYGIHPDEADGATEPVPPALSCVAIGEVGLDYHSGINSRKEQIALFEQMLELANSQNLPVIFHVRDAFDDFFAILNNFPQTVGVVHSFSDNPDNLQKSLARNFYIGVNGLVTFSPEIPLPPLDRMLLETDAPFLTPTPFRGTINEPAHIKDICAYISKLTGESEAKVAEITTNNAERLFKI